MGANINMMSPPLEILIEAPREECQEEMVPDGVVREHHLVFNNQQHDYIYIRLKIVYYHIQHAIHLKHYKR